MRHTFKQLALGAAAFSALLLWAPVARADMVRMKADLKGSSEVPPVNTNASGTADVTFDTNSKRVTWRLNYSGLSGNATAAHFHGPAEEGKNAGIAVPIPNPASGTEGSATLNDAQANDLMGGRYYINVHTQQNPQGEIRGQVKKQ